MSANELNLALESGVQFSKVTLMRTTAEQLSEILDHWRSGKGPLYLQLANAIIALAEAGSLEHGARLPSERALAKQLHLSRNTVTSAYIQLRDQGWLEGKPGAAPRLGSHSRGVMALSPQERFSRILVGTKKPKVAFNTASPPPAPIVEQALHHPLDFLGSPVVFGNGYAALGDRDLLIAITHHLRAQGIPAVPEEIVITGGGQQAVWLAMTALGGPQALIALEAITYPGIFDALAASGSRPLALPMIDSGLDIGAAVKLIRAAEPTAMYLTTYHNPTGQALSNSEIADLLAATASAGTTIIDDRAISDLNLDGVHRPPLAALDADTPIITVGGMSKVFWGGLRIGWLHTNRTLAAQIRHRRAAMDMGSPAMMQRIAAKLLQEYFGPVVEWRIAGLKASLAAAEAAIAAHNLPWRYALPKGGPCLWVELPEPNSEKFADRSAAVGAPVAAGTAFEVLPGVGESHFRLPFYLPPAQMQAGIDLLAQI